MDIDLFESILDIRIESIRSLSGGEVSKALLVRTSGGEQLVVKHGADTKAGMFECEADGLDRIRATEAIRTPQVVLVHDGEDVPAVERLLALEFIPTDDRADLVFGRAFGAALAKMHLAGKSLNGKYGLDRDNFLGRQYQLNSWSQNWTEFYRERRILPQLSQAKPSLGQIAERVDRLAERMDELLIGMPHNPCLIHGDLWSGNFLAAQGQSGLASTSVPPEFGARGQSEPVLIDSAVYYGHPEIEWAFIDLFGGFPSGMRTGYDEIAPLDPGYEYRRPLLQLYHLLIHVNHFGRSYVRAVEEVCKAYGI